MRKFGELSKDKATIAGEVTLDVGRFVTVGGVKSSRHSNEWMKEHGFVPYVSQSIDAYNEKGGFEITLDGESKPVSYKNKITLKPAATQRAYNRVQIEHYASQNIAKNNSAVASMSAKDAFNDIVVDKYKDLIISLDNTLDKDLKTFDFVSTWDEVEDFENPGVIPAAWARLMAWWSRF